MKYIPTDVYMWYKLIFSNRMAFKTTHKVTALCLAQKPRNNWSEQNRNNELMHYYGIISSRKFMNRINELTPRLDRLTPHQRMTNKTLFLRLSKVTGSRIRQAYRKNGFRIFARKLLLNLLQNVKAMSIRLYCEIRFKRNQYKA